jgi:hypothetical protein
MFRLSRRPVGRPAPRRRSPLPSWRKPLKNLDQWQERRLNRLLDFVAPDFVFVASGLDFVAPDFDFVAADFDFVAPDLRSRT